MTIEECLAMAQRSLEFSDPAAPRVTPEQVAICNMYAQIAQAAALTAQVMIMREGQLDIAASNERAELQELWRQ